MCAAQYRRPVVSVGDIPTERRAGVAIGHGRQVGPEKACIEHDELHAFALGSDDAAFINAGAGLYFVAAAPISFIDLLSPFLEGKATARVICAVIMVVPCGHHRDATAEAVELDPAAKLLVARGQCRDVRAVGRPRVAIDIVANQQERLRLLRCDNVPEFHVAVFVDATAKGEARQDRVGGQSGIGRGLGNICSQRGIIGSQSLLCARRRDGGGRGQWLSGRATGEEQSGKGKKTGHDAILWRGRDDRPSLPATAIRVKPLLAMPSRPRNARQQNATPAGR